MRHVTEYPYDGSHESAIREGEVNNLIAASDLTSKAAALAAVDTKQAIAHVTIKQLAIPAKQALQTVDNVVPGATSGSSIANIKTGIAGDFGPGFPLT